MGKYDDIINMDRPKSNRPSMSRADRAKIFMPFAALKGYEEAIEEKQKLTTEKMRFSWKWIFIKISVRIIYGVKHVYRNN